MRFCFLASRDWAHPEAAGGDFYLSNLARSLAKRGHKVTYLASSFGRNSGKQLVDGVEICRIRPGTLYPVRLFRHYLRIRGSVDVVVEEIFGGKKSPTLARLYSGNRLVAAWYQRHERIFAEQYPRGIAKALSIAEKLLATIYRGYPVMTLSDKSARELSQMGISPARIGIVPSAALMDFPTREEIPPFEKREDSMIFIGKIRKYKRIDHAIRAVRRLRDSQRPCRLIVAGNVARDDKGYLTGLMGEAHRLGVDKLVDFKIYPGAIPLREKFDLLRNCKVLLQPSPVEGFSMTTVEANGCGTPVVVSDGVPRDAVVHGENGLVYPFGDVEAMADRCRELLENPMLWNTLSEKGLKMAERFSWDNTADAFENFVKQQSLAC